MIPALNAACLLFASIAFFRFYVKSAQPAALEKKIGPSSYKRCKRYRWLSSAFMSLACLNYILSYWFPIKAPGLPDHFPWPWWISASIAAVIALPCGYLMIRGARDAGEETMNPRKEHSLYGGIYRHIRHPQALGELPLWWSMAFLAHSPFLTVFSILYIPMWYVMCLAEEQDLLIRYGKPYAAYRNRTGMFWPKSR